MINPVSSVHTSDVHQASQSTPQAKPDTRAQTPPVAKSGAVSQDQVTLKSAGQTDPDSK